MLLDVIQNNEGRYGERNREEQTLNDIANVRAAGCEQSINRLTNFERQAAQPDPPKSIGINPERISEHSIEIKR